MYMWKYQKVSSMVMFSVRAVALSPGAGAQQNISIKNISMHFFSHHNWIIVKYLNAPRFC